MGKNDGGGLVRTTIMIPASVREELRRLAFEGNRSLSHEIRAALDAHIQHEKEAQE